MGEGPHTVKAVLICFINSYSTQDGSQKGRLEAFENPVDAHSHAEKYIGWRASWHAMGSAITSRCPVSHHTQVFLETFLIPVTLSAPYSLLSNLFLHCP